MSENLVFAGAAIILGLFVLVFLTITILFRRKAGGSTGIAGGADGGSGFESGHDWHMRQNEQFGHHHHDHGGSFDGGGGSDGGGGGGGGGD